MGMKYIKNPSKFLVDSGLLFEINRKLLHPFGFALALEVEDDNSQKNVEETELKAKIWDCAEDPEGVLFNEDTLAEGDEKYHKFFSENLSRLAKRMNVVGDIYQSSKSDNNRDYDFEKWSMLDKLYLDCLNDKIKELQTIRSKLLRDRFDKTVEKIDPLDCTVLASCDPGESEEK